MIDFLKTFFAGEKSPQEKMLAAAGATAPQKKRDVMNVEGFAPDAETPEDDDFCAPSGGCCGGGCRS